MFNFEKYVGAGLQSFNLSVKNPRVRLADMNVVNRIDLFLAVALDNTQRKNKLRNFNQTTIDVTQTDL